MPITGFVGSGYVGNFYSLTELNSRYPANLYAGRVADITTGNTCARYYSNGDNWVSLVSGSGIEVSTSRNITVADNGLSLKATTSITLTIPGGLSPMPSFSVDCPPSGTVTVAVSGGATLNGGTTALTRTRAANPVGFVVLAHEADAYGMSGS